MKKLKIIQRAFRKLKLKGPSADASIPQLPEALEDLESLMADLDAKPSINSGYNSTGEAATLDEESGLTLEDIDAVSSMLAIAIAPDYSIEVPQDVRMSARAGLSNMMKRGAVIPKVKYTSRMPKGMGNTSAGYLDNYYKATKASSDAIQFSKGSFVVFPIDFTSWLLGNTLTNVSWLSEGNHIQITDETFTNTTATAKLTFNTAGVFSIQVTGTSANGQVVETINFSIADKLGG